MKKNSMYLLLLVAVLCSFNSISAQRNVPFIEKWNVGQEKADSKVQPFIQEFPEVKHHKVNYKSFYDSIAKQTVALNMFIEVPKGVGPFPVVIFMHGGGFVAGDKSAFTSQSFAVAQKGIVGISIEYRLKGHGGTFPLFIADAMDAIDFVRKNAKTLSPLYQIKTPAPATLLFHGKEDTTVPYQQSVAFAEAIQSKGGTAEIMLFEGQKHGFFNKEPYLSKTTATRDVEACRPITTTTRFKISIVMGGTHEKQYKSND